MPPIRRTIEDISPEILEDLKSSISATPVSEPVPTADLTPLRVHPFDNNRHARRSVVVTAEERRKSWLSFFSLLPWIIGAGVVVVGLLYISQYGTHLKAKVIKQGSSAASHMLAAKDQLEHLDWSGAHDRFELARLGFDEAGSQLGLLGPAITGLLSKIPGLHSLKTGEDILQAGKLMAEAGSVLSQAVQPLAEKSSAGSDGSIAIIPADRLAALEEALSLGNKKLAQAKDLLRNVSLSDIPVESQSQFSSFIERLPQIQALIDNSSKAVTFLKSFSGDGKPKRYLVLFENSSELRPTGGFPGTYGLLTMQGGVIKDWRADDIYNPDGQLHELVVPPVQLQHITPGWGMRDANWFVDFPTSAKEVMSFWQKDGGAAVDGVIAVRPDVLADVLKVTGPVSLPGYDVVIQSDNVLATLQQEVEDNRPTGKPKQIIADLAPVVLSRMAALPADKWFSLLDTFQNFFGHRDLLAYFNDDNLQAYVDSQGWSGRVEVTDGDYMMTVISNIKGAKADAVTDTSLKLETRVEAGAVVHRLTITRQHNGGHTAYGFYNKTNYSYVRVLVPSGSTLRGITGNDHPNNKPMISYAGKDATRDPLLEALESTAQYDPKWDTTTEKESGKTSFGFWMRIEPGATQAVQLEYVVPTSVAGNPYSLLIQRQPGLDLTDVEVTLDKPGFTVAKSAPAMTEWPDSWRLHTSLDTDLRLSVSLSQ